MFADLKFAVFLHSFIFLPATNSPHVNNQQQWKPKAIRDKEAAEAKAAAEAAAKAEEEAKKAEEVKAEPASEEKVEAVVAATEVKTPAVEPVVAEIVAEPVVAEKVAEPVVADKVAEPIVIAASAVEEPAKTAVATDRVAGEVVIVAEEPLVVAAALPPALEVVEDSAAPKLPIEVLVAEEPVAAEEAAVPKLPIEVLVVEDPAIRGGETVVIDGELVVEPEIINEKPAEALVVEV